MALKDLDGKWVTSILKEYGQGGETITRFRGEINKDGQIVNEKIIDRLD